MPLQETTLAGFPTTTQLSGTSWITTAPAPIIQKLPIVVFGRIIAPAPTKVLSPIYKLLEEKVLNKEICFLDNGLLLDNFPNCRCKYSENMDKYLTKKSSNGKIDMVISLALALTQLEERELRYKRKQFISYDL